MSQEILDIYNRFGHAVARNDIVTASGCVDKSLFHCRSVGMKPDAWLDFSQFWTELGRQRAMFSDFGQRITQRKIVQGGFEVAAWYTHEVTFDGEMMARGSDDVASATGHSATISLMEIATFDPNTRKIIELIMESDRLSTINQMLGKA